MSNLSRVDPFNPAFAQRKFLYLLYFVFKSFLAYSYPLELVAPEVSMFLIFMKLYD